MHLNECTSSGYFFQEVKLTEEEYSTRLSHYINTGFPCDKKNLLTDLQEFWNHREALSIKSGLITCGNRIIVPKEMRAEICSTSMRDIWVRKDVYSGLGTQYFGQDYV